MRLPRMRWDTHVGDNMPTIIATVGGREWNAIIYVPASKDWYRGETACEGGVHLMEDDDGECSWSLPPVSDPQVARDLCEDWLLGDLSFDERREVIRQQWLDAAEAATAHDRLAIAEAFGREEAWVNSKAAIKGVEALPRMRWHDGRVVRAQIADVECDARILDCPEGAHRYRHRYRASVVFEKASDAWSERLDGDGLGELRRWCETRILEGLTPAQRVEVVRGQWLDGAATPTEWLRLEAE